jgi:serine protease
MKVAFKTAALALAWPLVMCAVLAASGPAWAARIGVGGPDTLQAVDGEVIVQFKAAAGVTQAHALAVHADRAAVDEVLDRRAAALGRRMGRTLKARGIVGPRSQVVSAPGVDAATLARQLAADPDVEFAEPNGRKRLLTAPNDPLYAAAAAGLRTRGPDAGQWYLRAPGGAVVSSINIEPAWARSLGSPSVVVAVLDTGVRFDHPDLGRVADGGKLLPGYDFVSDTVIANDGGGRDSDPSDPGDWVSSADLTADAARPANQRKFTGCSIASSSWHGTSTASLVAAAANNGIGMAGTAPGVRVLPVRVLGKCAGYDSDIQAGMLWAAGISVAGVPDNPYPAKVLNMSLGGSGACSASYQAVVDQLLAKGVVIVAAAGNSAGGPVGTPASCRGVISVLALRHVGTKVGFSDLGPEITIAAPGGNCVNTGVGQPCLYPILAATDDGTQGPTGPNWTDSFDYSVGTSFSSPLVAGTVGLMFSVQPGLTPAQIVTTLRATARPFPTTGGDNGDGSVVGQCVAPSSNVQQLQCYCNTTYCGAGMLDAGAAVTTAGGLAARVDVSAMPTAGQTVRLGSTSSTAASGRSIVGWTWTLLDGGGIVNGFTSATNASTATLLPGAAGSFTVRLTVTDDIGMSASADQTVSVAAGATATATPTPSAGSSGSGNGSGGGGGAASLPWLLALLAAVGLLRRAAPQA